MGLIDPKRPDAKVGFTALRLRQYTECPPSTGRVTPVMKSAPRDERKTVAPMISSGFSQRLAGVRAMISSFIGELRTAAVMSVSIQPGAIALTWMLCGANSIASDLVS